MAEADVTDIDVFSQVIADILAERLRQIEVEGFSPVRDDGYTQGQLANAAACYATQTPLHWPPDWDQKWWKPTTRRRDLVKAAALLVAELERLDRQAEVGLRYVMQKA
jgi:hypothetical protein